MKEGKPLSSGGYEEIFPKVFEELELSCCPERIALSADLRKNQWECIIHYMDKPDISYIAQQTGIARPNVYQHLAAGLAKLEKARRGRSL